MIWEMDPFLDMSKVVNALINFGAKVRAFTLVYQPIFVKVKVHFNASDFRSDAPVVLTVGTFDGVHIGHRAVIDLLTKRAREMGGESVLLTFQPHPRTVLHPEQHQLKLLNTIEERKTLLNEAGLDHLVIHPFTEKFSRKTPLEYVRDLFAEGIRPQKVIIGYDHRFGRNREGSFESLVNLGKVYGFSVEELPAQTIEETKVSSTKVREALQAGHVAKARTWLNAPYPLLGRVQRGEQLGRKLGYPTANLSIEQPLKLVPASGVYAVFAKIEGEDDWNPAMVNIGTRPTVSTGSMQQHIEVHLLQGGRQCYNELIDLRFMRRMRDEIEFNGLKPLMQQLQQDEKDVRSYLETMKIPLQPSHP